MTETRAQRIARLKAANPQIVDRVNGEDVTRDAAAYDASINQWADKEEAAEAGSVAEAAKKTLRQQVRDGLDTLATDETLLKGAPTAAQVRDATLHNNQAIQKLVRVLINAGVIEPNGG